MATTKKQTSDDFMSLKDLFTLCLSHWKWFVLSLFITIGIAVLYLLVTPSVYTRSASILIKDDSKSKSSISSDLNAFADLGLFNTNTNVNNELISIQSPAIILEVVKRLRLNFDYSVQGTFHANTLYGRNLPVSVTIDDMADNDAAEFTLQLGPDNHYTVSDLTHNGDDIDGTFRGTYGDTLATPLGTMLVTTTPYYSKQAEKDPVHVTRSGLINSITACQKKLTAALNDDKATIIDLTYRDVSIQRAEEFLNTLIAIYNENWVKDKNQIAVSTSQFINERLSVIEDELSNVDSDISTYKSENLIPDVESASAMYMQEASAANAQIVNLNNQLYMARYIRNAVTDNSRSSQLLPANSGINNATIEQQIATYNQQLLQRNSLVANSSEQNPLVQDLDAQLTQQRGAIISSIDNQISSLNAQVRGYGASAAASTSRIASNPTQAQYLLSVERQQSVKEQLYLFLLQKREENELSQAFTAYNTRIVTPPMGSLLPTSPVRRNVLLVAIALGLLIPLVILFIRENMNSRVRGRKDLEDLTAPFVGEIPHYGKKPSFWKRILRLFGKKEAQTAYQVVVKPGSRNYINEAFRVARTNLEFMLGEENRHRVIMITSSNPGSGKTFITMNLATTFAIKDKKVIAIDFDMRRASLSTLVHNPETGLADYLNGKVTDWRTLVAQSESSGHFDVIPVGTLPPNPTELLFTPRLEQLMAELRGEYDLIFLDCPPVEIVADSSIISRWADITLFVIRAELLERDMLPVIQSYYDDKKFHNMSLLLNGTYVAHSRYGYHRYGSYGYGYGNYGGYTKDE